MIRSLVLFIALTTFSCQLLAKDPWPATGKYEFTGWAGPQLTIYYSAPPQTTVDSPILIIIPGVKRNAEEYRDEWDHLATTNRFITLVVEATKNLFPTEYEYNVGGVINARGEVQPENHWLFSAIDPLFDDFKERDLDLTRKSDTSCMVTRRVAVLCTCSYVAQAASESKPRRCGESGVFHGARRRKGLSFRLEGSTSCAGRDSKLVRQAPRDSIGRAGPRAENATT